jgi:isobutyryl-CoA mutase
MTPEYGASSQLEKIDMLDFADLVAINKFDKRGALDALRDVRKTYQRNHKLFDQDAQTMPVFATSAHHFNDQGTNRFFNALFQLVSEHSSEKNAWRFVQLPEGDPEVHCIIPIARTRYLSEIANQIRSYHDKLELDAEAADKAQACSIALSEMHARKSADKTMNGINELATELMQNLSPEIKKNIEQFNKIHINYESKTCKYTVRDKTVEVNNFETSLSHQPIPKIALPHLKSWGDQLRFMQLENLPGYFPYTAGVFPFKRQGEDPARMFAGEGMPERTNKRFHYLSLEQAAKRLSTAFDSTTLYGADPDLRPDIYGKIGNAGVSVCSLDDAKRLYSGFNLCLPSTSVSMTINGPAPTILAFFLNAAIDSACERELRAKGKWETTEEKIFRWFAMRGITRPSYRAQNLPQGHDGMGLGFLGLPAEMVVDAQFYKKIKTEVLETIRGTVQADILKEDQAQNTCIFSTEFALRMMGDVQQYFIENNVRNFYSVSISGYHIAEAGANPITQLALTLANGFTLVEYYRARGMDINSFAPNLSFFFSNGLDPEYTVIGRVARRIWAIAMRDLYQADDRSQKLKYHIQTSGRSLHAQEINFNDIRTTLQALYAIMDNCSSLHTNAYDEAITTPTEESVRRALAIQLIIYRELGLSKNENPWQGSYFIEYMTNLVEEAVLKEFEALDSRGGVLGAMETMYQRSKIQEESMYYENKKMNGELPIIGVNTFLNDHDHQETVKTELIRSSTEEKDWQVEQVQELAKLWEKESAQAIEALKKAATTGGNIFTELMETSKYCTIGVITEALYEVGGAYRRGM